MRRVLVTIGSVLLLATAAARAGDPPATTKPDAAVPTPAVAPTPAMAAHTYYTPTDIKWSEAPPGLPKGAKACVLEGDLAAPGPFTIRAWMPAGYKVMPHTHPGIEHLTVISGAIHMAFGDSWDESKAHALPAGSFSIMPAGVSHYVWTKEETVIQVHGVGPWGINYVNPSDDPRNQKQATK